MSNILVTGISGFIASNLIPRLIYDGNTILGIDKEFTYRTPSNKSFTFILNDINNIELYQDNIKDIDIIYHLAASADVVKSHKDLHCDMKDNVLGTHSILELMRKNDIQKIVFASSSTVYGETKNLMIENKTDLRPICLYGASKVAGEAFINAYVDMYGLKSSIFRFANVVGKNEHRGVIPDFIKKLKKNPKELEILGDGNQIKSYFMVDDCIEALIKLKSTKPSSIYNLGNIDTINVTNLADIVINELGLKNVKYRYTGGDRGWKGDAPIVVLSINKAISKGWMPKYNCEESIRKTVRILKDNI